MESFAKHSDETLLEELRSGNELAFSEVFKRHWKKVYRMAFLKLRSEELAEELVQDLFLALWEKRETLEITNLAPYLATAIKHRVISHIRKQVVHQKYWDYYKTTFTESEAVTEKDIEYNELLKQFEHGLFDLPEKSKKVFKLNRLEGRSIPEIANMLNLSEKAIEYHLTRSLKQLRLHLKEYILPSIVLLLNVLSSLVHFH